MIKLSQSSVAALGFLVAGALTACSNNVASNLSPEEQVRARSAAYWDARMAGDVAKAYEFMTPGYRAVRSLEQYRSAYGSAPNLQDREVAHIACESVTPTHDEESPPVVANAQAEPGRCTLRASYTTGAPMMKGRFPIGVVEVWLHENGQWWLFKD